MNARAGRPVQASPLLIEALEVALRAAELTGGDVDPTVGMALELAGYDRDWRLLAAPLGEPEPPAITARVQAGWRTVTLDRSSCTIRIPRESGSTWAPPPKPGPPIAPQRPGPRSAAAACS